MVRRLLLLLLGVGLTLGVVTVPVAAFADSYSAPFTQAIADLPVAAEVRTGYSRSLFPHWIDADGDGCNTRYEVLIAEADDPVTVGSGCSLTGGRWFSYYDRVSWTDTGRIDIDHMVPLAEAWDSGARTWSTATRQAYANDLGDYRSLVGVTDTVNQSKGDKDPQPVDADLRQVPLPARVGGGEAPLAAQRRQRREERDHVVVVGLHQLDDHRDAGALSPVSVHRQRSRSAALPRPDGADVGGPRPLLAFVAHRTRRCLDSPGDPDDPACPPRPCPSSP